MADDAAKEFKKRTDPELEHPAKKLRVGWKN